MPPDLRGSISAPRRDRIPPLPRRRPQKTPTIRSPLCPNHCFPQRFRRELGLPQASVRVSRLSANVSGDLSGVALRVKTEARVAKTEASSATADVIRTKRSLRDAVPLLTGFRLFLLLPKRKIGAILERVWNRTLRQNGVGFPERALLYQGQGFPEMVSMLSVHRRGRGRGARRGRIHVTELAFIAALWAILAIGASRAPAGPFYRAERVGGTGDAGILQIFPGVSINDKGNMALVGRVEGGSAVFYAEKGQTLVNITSTLVNANRSFGLYVQINNDDRIVAVDRLTGYPTQSWLRVWEGENPMTFSQILTAPNATFENLWGSPCISNLNHVAFSGSNDRGQTLLGSGGNLDSPRIYLATVSLQPMVSDNGHIVYHARTPVTRVIVSDYRLDAPFQIAGNPEGFTALGACPGISEDGRVIAFAGDRGNGDGIFVAIKLESDIAWHTFRLVGENGATEIRPPDLGYDRTTQSAINFGHITVDSRLGVTSVPLSESQSLGPTYFVSFIATPSLPSPSGHFTDKAGMFVVPFVIRPAPGVIGYTVTPQFPIAVAQEGDSMAGTTIAFPFSNDPLARYATDDSGQTRTQQRHDHRLGFVSSNIEPAQDTLVRVVHEGHLSVVPHLQNAVLWQSQPYDHRKDNLKIGDLACAMTSVCMALDFIGVKTLPLESGTAVMNPLTMNEFLKANNGFTHPNRKGKGGGSVQWKEFLPALGGRPVQYCSARHSTNYNYGAAVDYLKKVLKAGYPVIVGVNLKLSDEEDPEKRVYYPGHFVLVTGYRDGDFLINDPGHKDRKKLLANYKYRFETRGYYRPGPDPQPRRTTARTLAQDELTTPTGDYSAITLALDEFATFMLTSPSGLRVGVDTTGTTATLIEEIPGSSVFADGLETNTGDEQPPIPPDSFSWYAHIPIPEEGEWQLVLTGSQDETFHLSLTGTAWDDTIQTPTLELDDRLAPDQTRVIPFTYSAEPTEVTPTPTDTPSPTATPDPSPTSTSIPSPTPTSTSVPSPTLTSTPEPSPTSTSVPSPTSTPDPTITSTPLPTLTSTPAPSLTSSSSRSSTWAVE